MSSFKQTFVSSCRHGQHVHAHQHIDPTKRSHNSLPPTLAGTIESYSYVQLKDITLPELDPSRHIESLHAYIFKLPCKYNMVLGTDFCATARLIIDCTKQDIHWLDNAIPFKSTMHYVSLTAALEDYMAATIDHFNTYTVCQQILESKYEEANTDNIANQQTHLTPEKRTNLAKLLAEFPQLFSGKLGSILTAKSIL
jgi:hypothetical protein